MSKDSYSEIYSRRKLILPFDSFKSFLLILFFFSFLCHYLARLIFINHHMYHTKTTDPTQTILTTYCQTRNESHDGMSKDSYSEIYSRRKLILPSNLPLLAARCKQARLRPDAVLQVPRRTSAGRAPPACTPFAQRATARCDQRVPDTSSRTHPPSARARERESTRAMECAPSPGEDRGMFGMLRDRSG